MIEDQDKSEPQKFDGFVLREVGEQDRAALDAWIADDPNHSGYMTADYFMGRNEDGMTDPRATCYAIEDAQGVVFFIRLSKAARVRIQFSPGWKRFQMQRNSSALLHGMAFLESMLARAGTEEWVFDTENQSLATFAIVKLGFEASPNELRRGIEQPAAAEAV